MRRTEKREPEENGIIRPEMPRKKTKSANFGSGSDLLRPRPGTPDNAEIFPINKF